MAADIVARLKLAGEDFSRALKAKFAQVPQEAAAAGTKTGAQFGKGFAVGFGSTAVIASVAAVATRALQSTAALKDQAQQLGVSTDELQKYRYAATQTGVAQGELDDALQRTTRNIGSAVEGNNALRRTFSELGVGLVDTQGKTRATGDVFRDLIDRISQIEDPAKRAQVEMQLFGEKGQQLDTLLAGGVDQVNNLARAAEELGYVLSAEQIQKADETARKFEQLKIVLEARIAGVVTENADAILALTDALGGLAEWSGKALLAWRGFVAGQRAIVAEQAADSWFASPEARLQSLQEASRQRQIQLGAAQSYERIGRMPPMNVAGSTIGFMQQVFDDARRSNESVILPPTATNRRTGGGGGGRRSSSNENAREREAKRAADAELRMRERLEETIKAQEQSAAIAELRSQGLETEADKQEALNRLADQYKDIWGKTAEEIAKANGWTVEQAQAQLDLLENARKGAVGAVTREHSNVAVKEALDAIDKIFEEAKKAEEDKLRELAELQRRQIDELAWYYEQAFSGRFGDIWRDFKQQGIRAVAEIAAQWTLSMLSGQKFDLGAAVGGMANGGNPLFSLISGLAGGGRVAGAASSGVGAAKAAGKSGILPGDQPNVGGMGDVASTIGSLGASAGPVGAAVAVQQTLGQIFGLDPTATLLGGLAGGFLLKAIKPTKRGSATLGMDAFGGLGVGATRGNSKSRIAAASSGIGSVAENLMRIAEAVGGTVTGSGSVSIGIRDKNWRVDPTGRGITKTKKGAIDFGQDQEAAIRYALSEALRDGVVGGISAASQRILQSGQDLEKAIEKAVSIEEIPKLLKARLDPLGAALDAIDARFRTLAATLKEGGASAEQIAQARQLWELERADAIKEISDASAGLKEFLKSLRIGGDSPLSLRAQAAEAEGALKPFLDQITEAERTRAVVSDLERRKAAGEAIDPAALKAAQDAAAAAAGKIDQQGYQDAAQAVLGIDRQINGSRSAFFEQFDRIQSLTNSAISLVDKAVPLRDPAKDPFAEATAQATKATATILEQQTQMLSKMEAYLQQIANGTGQRAFIGNGRAFV